MTEVTLTFKDGKKTTTDKIDVEQMNIFQFKKVFKTVNELLKTINTNEHIKKAFDNFSKTRADVVKESAEDEKRQRDAGVKEKDIMVIDVGSETLKRLGADFFNDILGSFEIVLTDAPDKLHTLISEATNISEDVIGEQDIYTLLDLIDAIVAENDIPKLVERLKKSKDSLSQMFNLVVPKADTKSK